MSAKQFDQTFLKFEMKKRLSGTLVMVLLASAMLVVTPTIAQGIVVPGDKDGDKIVSKDELASEILPYMLGKPGHLGLDEVREIAHIHVYYPKTITDSVESEVTIYRPIERVIIDFWIDAALTLQSLKAEDVVVGVTDVIVNEPILFPELSELPCIGVVYWPDYEKILELEPDVVLIGTDYMTFDEIQATIQSLDPDIVVLRFDYGLPSSYADEVTKLGYIFDREEEAQELINFVEGHLSTIDEIVSDIPSDNRTKVYEEWWGDYTTTGEPKYVEMAGGNNIFSEIVGYPSAVDREELIERQPEVIIRFMSGGYQTDDVTEFRNKRDEIMDRPGFDAVPAVDSERVYIIHSNIIASPMYFVGVAYYAKWFYPEEFGDLDPNAIHQEYLTKFLRIDYDLSKHGVFVYHPAEHPDGR